MTNDRRRPLMEDDFDGRQPLMVFGRHPSLKDDLRLEDNLRWKTSFDGGQNSIEDDLQWKTSFSGGQLLIQRF